jgi:hypothetical protein
VESEGFGDLLADRQRRVERRHRVLKDHAHLAATDGPKRLLGRGGEVDVVAVDERRIAVLVPELLGERRRPQRHLAAGDPPGVVDESHGRERRDALAAPGFADETDGLAVLDVERDAVDGLDLSPLGRELRPDVRQ